MAANKAAGAGLPLADAYLPWARATNFRDALLPGARGEWHWLLLELSETTSASEFALAARQSARDDLRVAHGLVAADERHDDDDAQEDADVRGPAGFGHQGDRVHGVDDLDASAG